MFKVSQQRSKKFSKPSLRPHVYHDINFATVTQLCIAIFFTLNNSYNSNSNNNNLILLLCAFPTTIMRTLQCQKENLRNSGNKNQNCNSSKTYLNNQVTHNVIIKSLA